MDEYIYGVARIRALEAQLFTDSDIDSLVEAEDYESALQFLRDKGWGDNSSDDTLANILKTENKKIKKILDDVIEDKKDREILMVDYDYHNLKAAMKRVYTSAPADGDSIYLEGEIDSDKLEEIVTNSDFSSLPKDMADAAQEASDQFLKNGDVQMIDVIIDKALLERIKTIGEESDNDLIKDYADTKIGLADIKIAIRASQSGKDSTFAKQAMTSCKMVGKDALANAVDGGFDAVCDYLESIGLKDIADAAKKSKSYFECVCDNKMIEKIKTQKYESFSIGPILAYALARENEIKTVNIILSGKLNGFDKDFIRERVRDMYE